MNLRGLLLFFLFPIFVNAQQKISKVIKSDARYVDLYIDGIDELSIEISETDVIEIIIIDKNKSGVGVFESFNCEEQTCVLKVKAALEIKKGLPNKINQFPIAPPSNVSATIKIPKGKEVSIIGAMVDIQSKGYQGVLNIHVDKGYIALYDVKGKVQINLFAGQVTANITTDIALDIQTRKGTITLDEKEEKSPYQTQKNTKSLLKVSAVNANVVLTSKKT